MRRHPIAPRADWTLAVERVGFDFHTIDSLPYWDESAYWELSAAEVDALDDAAVDLHGLCLEAAGWAIDNDRLEPFGITGHAAELVRESWRRREPSLYGRFDFAWTGEGPPKLLEYNADTPTSLFETAIVQWTWLQDRFPDADQFNSLHERLLDRFAALAAQVTPDEAERRSLHLASVTPHAEDEGTVRYLAAVALEAGFATKTLGMGDIGWTGSAFVDLENQPIERLFKLYPWEWLVAEAFGAHLHPDRIGVLEPAWKMVLANKAILSLLWEMYPDHPNLLPAGFAAEGLGAHYARKPLTGREGQGVSLFVDGRVLAGATDAPAEPMIYQQTAPLARAGEGYAVLGVWMVDKVACGLGIREDASPITTNNSRFVPHLFR